MPIQARCSRALLSATLTIAAMTTTVRAQGVSPMPAGPNTIIGVVTDESGMPVANADVFVESLHRRMLSRTDGSFRFDSVELGVYKMYARRMGYVSAVYDVRVRDDGGAVYIKLARIRQALPSVQTTASRGGVTGTIADPRFTALADVDVSVMGGGQHTSTDSSGSFFLPLDPGSYVLQMKRSGFVAQLIGVSVPVDEGRHIAAWMEPQSGRSDAVLARNLFDLEQRMIREGTVWTKYYTREDMARMDIATVRQLANLTALRPLSPDCTVTVNGGPTVWPIWVLETSDIEFVEITPWRTGGTGRNTNTRQGAPAVISSSRNISTDIQWKDALPARSNATCSVDVSVWLRR